MKINYNEAELQWHKSSHSNGDGGACVEVATIPGGAGFAVRDSKDQSGPVLTFTPAEWNAFLAGAQGGEFNA